ncbi:MAG: hypothetical protein WC449_05645 [Candidatus Paceibacterota bacterium]
MPSSYNLKNLTGEQVLKQYDSASYQINGGSSIAGGTLTSEASPFTDTVTVTGVATTDARIGISPRDAVVLPAGLALISIVVSATNTLQITWKNTTQSAISPPAAGVWSVAVLGNYIKQ